MQYERSLMAQWDEYARNKTAEEEGIKKGIEIGINQEKENVVKNLFAIGESNIAKIAGIAGVTEDFVRKVKKNMK